MLSTMFTIFSLDIFMQINHYQLRAIPFLTYWTFAWFFRFPQHVVPLILKRNGNSADNNKDNFQRTFVSRVITRKALGKIILQNMHQGDHRIAINCKTVSVTFHNKYANSLTRHHNGIPSCTPPHPLIWARKGQEREEYFRKAYSFHSTK